MDDRRIAVAVLSVLLGAVTLVFGGTAAQAATGPCDDDAIPTDIWVNVGNVVFVGAQPYSSGGVISTPSYTGAWVCLTPPGNAYAVEFLDNDSSKPGGVVWVYECDHPVTSCHKAVDWTGADVNPVTTTNAPLSGASGTGGSLGIGTGTCLYVNSGTPICPFGTGGATVADVTVHEGDLPTATTTNTTPPPACTGINNTCPGAYVEVGGDSTNDTVDGNVAVIGRVNPDVGYNCVHVNSQCPTTP